jgi:hypothetical protein
VLREPTSASSLSTGSPVTGFFSCARAALGKKERRRKSAIERDLLANFGEVPMEQIDKFMLQTHLNRLARTLSEG